LMLFHTTHLSVHQNQIVQIIREKEGSEQFSIMNVEYSPETKAAVAAAMLAARNYAEQENLSRSEVQDHGMETSPTHHHFQTQIIQAHELSDNDILIKDRLLVDPSGRNDARESNTSRHELYYSKLISRVARAMMQQDQGERWTTPTIMKAAVQIVKSVRGNKRGRFIWLKTLQGPQPQYVVLSEDLASQKVSNDIRCQMRLFDAQQQNNAPTTAQQPELPTFDYKRRLACGKRFIAQVYNANKGGLSTMEAAHTLDDPVAPKDWPDDKVYHESEEERIIRLQLRQRYFALARTNTSIHDFSMAMLAGWSQSDDSETKRKKRKIRSNKDAIAQVVNAATLMLPGEESQKADMANTINPEDLPPSFPPKLFGPLGIDHDDVMISEKIEGKKKAKKKKKAEKSKASPDQNEAEAALPSRKKPQVEKRKWDLKERTLFLEGFEKVGAGNWIQISENIPTR